MTRISNKIWPVASTLLLIEFLYTFHEIDSKVILENDWDSPLVRLDQGSFIGNIKPSRHGNSFFEFLGLRYAKPPGRFETAELIISPGEEQLEAKTIPPVCPQAFTPELTFDNEDCLFLNVFVPMRKSEPTAGGFPVMVWFHGGAFGFGSGASYEPQYFMDEDVILVTANYRLGALGFLSTGDNVIPGNLGLKDQIIALKWVQKNIQQFGGDNKRVTIAGHSAGAASVQYLMLSPVGKGLFHNAIMQSGSVGSLWAFDDRPTAISKAKRFCDKLGCPSKSSELLLKCLKEKSVEDILGAQTKLYIWNTSPSATFVPTVEDVGSSDMVFLSEHPLDLLERKEFTKVPLLTGVVPNEGLTVLSASLIKNEKLLNDLDSNFLQIAPIAFEYSSWFQEEYLDEVSRAIRYFYFKDKSIGQVTFENLTNLCSDAFFVYGVWKSIVNHAMEINDAYAYVMPFVDESSDSLTQLVTGDKELVGVAHGDELQYLFRVKELFPYDSTKSDRAVEFSKRLVKLWASFIQHKKPEATWGSSKTWPSITQDQLKGEKPFLWYELNEVTKISENLFMERTHFWEELMKKYSRRTFSENKKTEL